MRRSRLDAELVRRGLARSREHAADLVAAGQVLLSGAPASKPASLVAPDTSLRVVHPTGTADYVSRGGAKLAGALTTFTARGLAVAGRRALDVGASTGGFTQALLCHGATEVVAVDVGYGQLAWSLRTDPRVTVLERTNARDLRPAQIGAPVDLVVADLSFISLTLVLPALVRCARPDADLVLLVKPQFEVGRDRVGSGGVVRDPELRAYAVRRVADAASRLALGVRAVVASRLPGPAGNVEYFVWLHAGAPPLAEPDLARALAEGPP